MIEKNKYPEYITYRCDHCTGKKRKKQGKQLKPVFKKISNEKLYFLIKKYILAKREKIKKDYNQGKNTYIKTTIYAEKLAEKFQVKKHKIKQIFAQLNQEGLISQAENKPPHDCRRNSTWSDWGNDNSWIASRYYIKY